MSAEQAAAAAASASSSASKHAAQDSDPSARSAKRARAGPKRCFAALKPGLVMSPWEFEPKPLQADEVAVRITDSGICHSDIHKICDEWGDIGADPGNFPMCPGHEAIGVIVEKGEQVTELEVGDRVGFGPQRDSCRTCDVCKAGDEQLCADMVGLYDPETGGYAEHIRCPARFAFKIPDSIPSHLAGPLMCAGVTTYSPFAYYAPKPGARVAVVGVGGLGHMALQYARAMGYHVTAFSRTPSKEPEARNFGAHDFQLVRTPEDLAALKRTQDFILVTASANLDFNAYLEVLRPNGQLCLVGLPPKPVEIKPFKLIQGRRSFVGSPIGGVRLMKEMLEFSAEHNIYPQVEVVKITDWSDAGPVNEALQKVVNNQARYRMVMTFPKDA